MPRDTFERFYLQRVALSEACGCAEAVIRYRDVDSNQRARESLYTGRARRRKRSLLRFLSRSEVQPGS